MKLLNYNSVPSYQNILILGGGESTKKARDRILELTKNINPIIISPNITHLLNDIIPDFLLFIDQKIFDLTINNIKNKNIILGSKIKLGTKKQHNNIFYRLQYNPKNNKNINKIQIKDSGYIKHMVGNSGIACLLSSIFFKPKCIYFSGFDGPNISTNYISHYNGKKGQISYEKIKKISRFQEIVISYIISKNINLISFKEDKLWGINKSRLGIKTY